MPAAYASDEKRAELVGAAAALLYAQGLQRTTLSHVAEKAGVPLGNVYYYFKTKDALAKAVIDSHLEGLAAALAAWESKTPLERLLAFLRAPMSDADNVVRFGCPFGSLCHELEKLGADAPLAKSAARLLELEISWVGKQFLALGVSKGAAEALAVDLIASLQGMMLLAQTLSSKDLLRRQTLRIEAWVAAQVA